MMPFGSRVTVATLVLLLAATAAPRLQPPGAKDSRKLLVLIVVDQMRFDYLDRAATALRHGLARLRAEGAIFERAAYPYAATVTCPGHSTIASGAVPARHGIISNEWWSRADGRRVVCTDDETVWSVSYTGGSEKSSHSARRLRVPTLGDRLRAANRDSRVVTLSIKPRSAIMLAGQAGAAVTWFVDATHGWATSTAYAAQPVPEVQAFFDANPIDRDRTAVWTPLDPASFTGTDDAAGERPKPGWTATFPHPLAGATGTPPTQFYELWKCSPYSDEYLAALAIAQVRALRLGQRAAVDLLGVSFSSLDCVGHDFGPDSAEVHDTVLRLDRTLGTLFAALDQIVGRDRYVVGFSADHGVSPIPEQRRLQGADAGRVLAPEVRQVAETAMVAAHGTGPHIAAVIPPFIYFTPHTRARVRKAPHALRPVVDAVAAMNGILRVMPTQGLESKRRSSDRFERAAAMSYHPAEGGDIMFLLKPEWINGDSSAASHGTPHEYDQRVPIVLMGAPFNAGRFSTEASPADIAPTLAATIGLKLSGVDGNVLKPALR
jgi:arylsulfatase A-like enzyme